VQPAHAIDSEFSSHLRRYAARGDLSLVATSPTGQSDVPEVCYVELQKMQLLMGADSKHQTQCRPIALSICANSEWEACLRHHELVDSCVLRPAPLSTCKLSSCDTCFSPPSTLPRLLFDHVDSKFGLYISAVRNVAGVSRYSIDCSCASYKIWQGCHSFLRCWFGSRRR